MSQQHASHDPYARRLARAAWAGVARGARRAGAGTGPQR